MAVDWETAVGIVGDAAAAIAIPGSGAESAGRRDVKQLIVGDPTDRTGSDARGVALAGCGDRLQNRGGLSILERDSGKLRLQLEIGDVGKLQAIAEAVAIVSRRIADATRDGNPGCTAHAEQTNSRGHVDDVVKQLFAQLLDRDCAAQSPRGIEIHVVFRLDESVLIAGEVHKRADDAAGSCHHGRVWIPESHRHPPDTTRSERRRRRSKGEATTKTSRHR